jgi:putative ABC transport system ATP-binding protein
VTSPPGGKPVIRLSSVAYTYRGPPPVTALKQTDLVIGRGEHVAITGPSGSGKSTLLNLLGLLDRPTQGTIEIDGIDVGAAPERERAAVRAHRIGFVFQSFHLLPYRTSVENVMLAQVYADEPRRRRREKAMAALAQVGLEQRAHALPTALSGGERQRVAIARALVNRPSLLMCDEPTGNLDTVTTMELTELLGALHREGATLVVITHNPSVAAQAQRQIAIRDGELTELPPSQQPPEPAPPAQPTLWAEPVQLTQPAPSAPRPGDTLPPVPRAGDTAFLPAQTAPTAPPADTGPVPGTGPAAARPEGTPGTGRVPGTGPRAARPEEPPPAGQLEDTGPIPPVPWEDTTEFPGRSGDIIPFPEQDEDTRAFPEE